MHDPMVVAHEIPSPIPHRAEWRERKGRRWGFDVSRRTNPDNLGQRTYPWWRPVGYTLRLAGRAYGLGRLATIWHVEPGGRDAFEVCKHRSRWKWHVHHWHIQIHALQGLRARLFDRCALCGRKGRPNISHQWDGKRLGWWKFRSREGVYHRECSELGQLRNQRETDEELVRYLVAAYRVATDQTETEALSQLTDPKSPSVEFKVSYRLTRLMGYERGDNYELVRKAVKS